MLQSKSLKPAKSTLMKKKEPSLRLIKCLKKARELKKEYETEIEKRNRSYIGGCIDCDANQNNLKGPCYNHNAVEDLEDVIRLGEKAFRNLEKEKKFFAQFKKQLDFYQGSSAYKAFK